MCTRARITSGQRDRAFVGHVTLYIYIYVCVNDARFIGKLWNEVGRAGRRVYARTVFSCAQKKRENIYMHVAYETCRDEACARDFNAAAVLETLANDTYFINAAFRRVAGRRRARWRHYRRSTGSR